MVYLYLLCVIICLSGGMACVIYGICTEVVVCTQLLGDMLCEPISTKWSLCHPVELSTHRRQDLMTWFQGVAEGSLWALRPCYLPLPFLSPSPHMATLPGPGAVPPVILSC